MGWFSDEYPTIVDSDIISDLPEELDDFSCGDWKVYYQRIKKRYGRDKAVEVWNIDTDRTHGFASGVLCRYNCTWVQWAKKEGLNYGSTITSDIYCSGKNITSAAEEATTGLGGFLKIAIVLVGGSIVYKTITS